MHTEYLNSKQQSSEYSLKKVNKLENERSENLKTISEYKLKLLKHSEVVAWNNRYKKEIKEHEEKNTDFLAKQFKWNKEKQDLTIELDLAHDELAVGGIDWNIETENLGHETPAPASKTRVSDEIVKELEEVKKSRKKLSKEVKDLKKNI